MNKFLIINADDFGITISVNDAIIRVFQKGNLTSATLMVNMPGFEDAVEKAKANPGLGVGLHFCLTQGKAVAGVSSLTDNHGSFFRRGELNRKVLTGAIRKRDIVNELRAQLNKFNQHLGTPTHLDSHQHLHMNPWVFLSILPELKQRNIRVRLIAPPPDFSLIFHRPVKAFKQFFLMLLAGIYRQLLGKKTNDYLVSIHEAKSIPDTDTGYYREVLKKSKPGKIVELMVHPYLPAEDIREFYPDQDSVMQPFLKNCIHEYNLLNGLPVFKNDPAITLIRYDQF
jgi:predicted glycoside hydrolase/deacetylase ChbG (UPF0249 family)